MCFNLKAVMHIKLRVQLPLTLLLLLHLRLQLIAARHLADDTVLNSGNNSGNETTGLSPKIVASPTELLSEATPANGIENLNNKTNTLPEKKVDPNAMKLVPRFTLDTLIICGEGFKLFGNHCRREV